MENVVERLSVMATGEVIESTGLVFEKTQVSSDDFFQTSTLDWPTIDQLNQRYIDVVLTKTGGRKEKAAQILGINRRTLYRREKDKSNA